MVSVGDPVKLLQDQNGRSVACQSSTPSVGDTGVVLPGSDGRLYFHKSGTPAVGDQVLIVQSGQMRYALSSAVAAAPVPTYGAFAVGYGSRMDGSTRYGQVWIINTTSKIATMVLEKQNLVVSDCILCNASGTPDQSKDARQYFGVLYFISQGSEGGIPYASVSGTALQFGVFLTNRDGSKTADYTTTAEHNTPLNNKWFKPRFTARAIGNFVAQRLNLVMQIFHATPYLFTVDLPINSSGSFLNQSWLNLEASDWSSLTLSVAAISSSRYLKILDMKKGTYSGGYTIRWAMRHYDLVTLGWGTPAYSYSMGDGSFPSGDYTYPHIIDTVTISSGSSSGPFDLLVMAGLSTSPSQPELGYYNTSSGLGSTLTGMGSIIQDPRFITSLCYRDTSNYSRILGTFVFNGTNLFTTFRQQITSSSSFSQTHHTISFPQPRTTPIQVKILRHPSTFPSQDYLYYNVGRYASPGSFDATTFVSVFGSFDEATYPDLVPMKYYLVDNPPTSDFDLIYYQGLSYLDSLI